VVSRVRILGARSPCSPSRASAKVKKRKSPCQRKQTSSWINDLNSVSGNDFDKTYADQQANAHKQAVNLFESYAKSGDNAAVKQFASKTLPVIKQHLNDAQKLP
jgi:putative membrane protein